MKYRQSAYIKKNNSAQITHDWSLLCDSFDMKLLQILKSNSTSTQAQKNLKS